MESGNIWSGDKTRAAFTNPTELAFRKGNIQEHYPVIFHSLDFEDAEHAYHNFAEKEGKEKLMTEILTAKLKQHSSLVEIIEESGGEDWIKVCDHIVYGNSPYWEGKGTHSRFIRCLLNAYIMVIETNNKVRSTKEGG